MGGMLLFLTGFAMGAFLVLFVVLLLDTINKRRNAKPETQEYYVATTDADDED